MPPSVAGKRRLILGYLMVIVEFRHLSNAGADYVRSVTCCGTQHVNAAMKGWAQQTGAIGLCKSFFFFDIIIFVWVYYGPKIGEIKVIGGAHR